MKKFIELLRRGTVEGRDSAIDCLRTALAPCALDAYPVLAIIFLSVTLFVCWFNNCVVVFLDCLIRG